MKQAIRHKIFTLISEVAAEMKLDVYVVGGFVRDFFMGRPSTDIDIVVVGSGIDLAREVAGRIGSKTDVNVYKNFGTAMINYYDQKKWQLEFVGARKESYRMDSRKPVVEEGTLEDDQNRRDFTINAMAISLKKDEYGKLIDPFSGLRDLDRRILRTPRDPNVTFSDDPLRMMRAIRFAAQLEFKIESFTYQAIKRNRDRINIISKERIIDELTKIIMSPEPSAGFHLLHDSGLLAIIFPEFDALVGAEYVDGKGHKDNFYHTLQVLDNVAAKSDNLWLRWAAIMHDIAKPVTKRFNENTGWTFHGHEFVGSKMVPKIFRKMKLPLDDRMEYVKKLVQLHLRPQALSDEEVTDSAVRRLLFDAGDDIDDLMLLCEADITSKNEQKVTHYLQQFKIVRKKLKEIEEKDRIRNWQPPISGNEIMKTFDIGPSKIVGVIKDAIKEAILNGDIRNNYEDAYRFMIAIGKKNGLEPVK